MSLRSGTTSRHALALLLAGHRHAPFLAVRGEKRCRPMTGKQKCLADAVARDANAVGSREGDPADGRVYRHDRHDVESPHEYRAIPSARRRDHLQDTFASAMQVVIVSKFWLSYRPKPIQVIAFRRLTTPSDAERGRKIGTRASGCKTLASPERAKPQRPEACCASC